GVTARARAAWSARATSRPIQNIASAILLSIVSPLPLGGLRPVQGGSRVLGERVLGGRVLRLRVLHIVRIDDRNRRGHRVRFRCLLLLLLRQALVEALFEGVLDRFVLELLLGGGGGRGGTGQHPGVLGATAPRG